jgi:hypothetical protein
VLAQRSAAGAALGGCSAVRARRSAAASFCWGGRLLVEGALRGWGGGGRVPHPLRCAISHCLDRARHYHDCYDYRRLFFLLHHHRAQPLLLRAGALFFCGATLLRQCRSGLLDALPLLPLLLLLRVCARFFFLCSARARCFGCFGGLAGLCSCGRAARALCRSVVVVMSLLKSKPGLV